MKKQLKPTQSAAEFVFGVTFYPDLWPREYLPRAFSLIAEAGMNVVRFGEMAWGNIETSPGRFDFEVFDEAIELAKKNGIKILFGIGTAAVPQWAIKKYPELKFVDHLGGLTPEYGPRPNACRDSALYLQLAEKYLKAVVARYKNNPVIWSWQIDNEPTYPPLDSTENHDFCHCPHTLEKFEAWAKEKYKDIETLNAAWGTAFWGNKFADFSDITTPKGGFWDAGNPHIYLDWFRFKSSRLNTVLRELSAKIKKLDPAHPVGTNNFVGLCNRVPDHAVVAQGMDWYGWDVYPKGTDNSVESFAENADIWRGICDSTGAQFIVAELQGGPNIRWGNPQKVSGSDLALWAHQCLAHGAQGILYHAFRPALFGSETGGFGILNANGSETERFTAIKKVSAEIKDNFTKLRGYQIKSEVAIAFLKASEIETYQEEGPARCLPAGWFGGRGDLGLFHSLNSIAGAYRVCFGSGLSPKFIFDDQLEREPITQKVLLLPNPYLLSEKAFSHVYNFVKSGGTLITEARFGVKDENAHLREIPYLSSLLEVKYQGGEIINAPLNLNKFGATASGFRDLIEAPRGVIAKFADGLPAILEKKLGKGKIIYAAYSLFQSLIAWDNRKLLEFIRKQLPTPQITVKSESAVEWVRWRKEKEEEKGSRGSGNNLLYLINHSEQAAAAKVYVSGKMRTTVRLKPFAAQLIEID
ncbi:MAG: beta-galactosidase [Candidatus Margulisiibacteriota bacterium]